MNPLEEYQQFLREDAARLAKEARQLRNSLDYLSHEAARRRRRAVFLLAVGVLLSIWLHDEHVEHCVVGGPSDKRSEFLCDVTFPLHEHSAHRSYLFEDSERPDADYPVEGRLVGFAVWSALIGGCWWWAYHQRRSERDL